MHSRANTNASALAIKVASQAGGQALLGVGVPGGQAVIEALLRDLLDVQDEQAAAVSRIDRSVQRLVDEPWKTARGLIKEASLPGTTVEHRWAKLTEAASALRRAVSVQQDRTFEQAYASLDLAIVLRMLGDVPASIFQAEQALAAAVGYMGDLVDWAEQKQRKKGYEWWAEHQDQFLGVVLAVNNLDVEVRNRSDLEDLDWRWLSALKRQNELGTTLILSLRTGMIFLGMTK